MSGEEPDAQTTENNDQHSIPILTYYHSNTSVPDTFSGFTFAPRRRGDSFGRGLNVPTKPRQRPKFKAAPLGRRNIAKTFFVKKVIPRRTRGYRGNIPAVSNDNCINGRRNFVLQKPTPFQ